MSTGAPSRSALDMLKWLEPEDLHDTERSFWRFLCNKAECYPQQFIPPLRKPMGRPRIHQQVGAKLDRRNGPDGQPIPVGLWLFDGSDSGSYQSFSLKAAGSDFAAQVLTTRYRSCFIVFSEGGRVDLRLIATQFGAQLLELGFTIDVLMGGGRLKALIIKRGRHRWYLCCWESLSGRPAREVSLYQSLYTEKLTRTVNPAATVYRAAMGIQAWLMKTFGCGLSLTISNTSLRAAARSLPIETCKFKPLPLLVSLCRNGGGFRGGLLRGTRYRGPAWIVDLNRAYTAALEKPLPWAYVFDRCEKNGVEREGIYVCRVTGSRGLSPVYIGTWNGTQVDVSWHSDPDGCGLYCVLTTAEVSGLRSIGYHVTLGWGFVFTRTLSLAAFVATIRTIVQRCGPLSALGKLTKQIGNSVFGKFASPPERRDLRISRDKPGRDWTVFVDDHGWPVADLWERIRCIYQWSQHVDIASVITSRVRGVMYAAQAEVEQFGGTVVGMQTDSLVLDVDPAGILQLDAERFGSWRLAYSDPDGYVVGANCWSVGHKNVIPDNPNPIREDVVRLWRDYPVEISATKSGTPAPGAPLSIAVIRRIMPPGRASPSVAAD